MARYFAPQRKLMARLALAVLSVTALGLAEPLLMSRGLQWATETKSINVIVGLAAALLLTEVLNWVFARYRRRTAARLIAEIVGRMLHQLGVDPQVLCVTHLPQVASRARYQCRVSKFAGPHGTLATVEPLDAAGRVEEIARMLGGAKITATTRRHAEEMLAEAAAAKGGKGRRGERGAG